MFVWETRWRNNKLRSLLESMRKTQKREKETQVNGVNCPNYRKTHDFNRFKNPQRTRGEKRQKQKKRRHYLLSNEIECMA